MTAAAGERGEAERRAARVRLVIFDVDGVLTDGGLLFDAKGRELKMFSARDGHGIKMLQASGVGVAVLSGRRSEAVRRRMKGLGVRHVQQGLKTKLPAYEALREALRLAPEEIAYAGDDVIDVPVMRRVGLAIAVQDAHPLVKEQAHLVTALPGGRGAGREACEFIMAAQGTLQEALEAYLR